MSYLTAAVGRWTFADRIRASPIRPPPYGMTGGHVVGMRRLLSAIRRESE
jgi:hypothetical protein